MPSLDKLKTTRSLTGLEQHQKQRILAHGLNRVFRTLDLLGTCPTCKRPALNFTVDPDTLHLTWSCLEGCNP